MKLLKKILKVWAIVSGISLCLFFWAAIIGVCMEESKPKPTEDLPRVEMPKTTIQANVPLATTEITEEDSGIGWGTGIILFIITFIVLVAVYNSKVEAYKGKIKKKLLETKDFNLSEMYIGEDHKTCIAVDKSKTKVCLARLKLFKPEETTLKVVKSHKIISVSTSQADNETVSKKVSGGFSSKKMISGIELCLIIDDDDFPTHSLQFMSRFLSFEKGSNSHKKTMEKVKFWEAILSVCVNRGKAEGVKEEKMVCSYCGALKDTVRCSVCGAYQ